MTTLKRKTQLNLSGSHRTLDADNAFVGGTVYVTGSVSASVDVIAQRVTASYFSGSATQNFGSTAGNLGGALVIQSPMFLSGTAVSSAFGATDLQFVVGLKDNNYVFGVDSGSISWGSGSGLKIVPSSTPDHVELWLNGQNIGDGGGGGGGGGNTAITGGIELSAGPHGNEAWSGSITLGTSDGDLFFFGSPDYWNGGTGVGKFTLNTVARFESGTLGDGNFGAASWTHVVTFVSSSSSTNPTGDFYPLAVAEIDYITHSFGNQAPDMSTFDVNIYAAPNDLLIGVTGAVNSPGGGGSFSCTVTDGFVTSGGGNTKPFFINFQ